MDINAYINELGNAIDDARSNPNDHTYVGHTVRDAHDMFQHAHDRQSKRAELWQVIIDFREERLSEEDLFSFMQSFDKSLTYYQFIQVLEDI